MRVLFGCLLAGLLLVAYRTAAQIQPLRVSPPAVAGQLAPGLLSVGHDSVAYDAAQKRFVRLKPVPGQRNAYKKKQQALWYKQMNDQATLARGLEKVVSDSLRIAYDTLTARAARSREPKAVAAYSKNLQELEAAQAHIAARVAAYQLRELYCRFRARNAGRVTFRPVTNRYETPLFFQAVEARPQAEFLNQATTVINPRSGKFSLYNEVFGDYVGWWRIGVGTTLVASNQGDATTPEQQKQEAAVQRLIGGGGNILLSSSFPIAYYHSFDNVVALRLMTTNNFATDLPQANSSSSSFAYHFDVGFDLAGYYRGSRNIITPFIYLRLGRAWGNDLFYDNLGYPDNKGLTVGQLRAGIDITDVFQVAGSFTYGSSFIRDRFPFALTLTVKPRLPTSTAAQ